MKKLLVGGITLAAMAWGGVWVAAQEAANAAPQTRVYIIQRGDTLWDLAASKLNSPWYWPRIWQLNPSITNPHRIFPGQQVAMPGPGGVVTGATEAMSETGAPAAGQATTATSAPAQEAAQAAPAAPAATSAESGPAVAQEQAPTVDEQAAEEAPQSDQGQVAEEQAPEVTRRHHGLAPVEENLPQLPSDSRLETAVIPLPKEQRFYVRLGSEGFISSEGIKAAATIVGSHLEKSLYTEDDKVFISLGQGSGVEPGQRFTAYRQDEEVFDPQTGESAGWRTVQLGVIEVISVQEDVSTARVIAAYDAIDKGSLLVPFQPYEQRIVPQPSPAQLDGVVLTPANQNTLAGEGSIIYVDRGTDDNLQVGQIMQIYRPWPAQHDSLTGRDLAVPPKILGQGIVVDAQKHSATVLVWNSNDYIEKGDHIGPLAMR